MSLNDLLIFNVADILQMNLVQEHGKIRGATVKDLKLGPWMLKLELVAHSDVLNDRQFTAFARIMGGAWVYAISESKRLWLIVFDGDAAGIKPKDVAAYCEGDSVKTLKKLGPHIRGQYMLKDGEWNELPIPGEKAEKETA